MSLVATFAGRADKAVIGAKKTLAIYPKAFSALHVLTATYVEMSRREEAEKVAQKVLEIDITVRCAAPGSRIDARICPK